MAAAMNRRARFTVRGQVQGVCYRMYAREKAAELGLTGWVRNRHDGTVEVLAEGDDGALAEFLAWCRTGPPHARVSDVAAAYSEPTREFGSFEIAF
jgi:acylphosphatase